MLFVCLCIWCYDTVVKEFLPFNLRAVGLRTVVTEKVEEVLQKQNKSIY